MKSKATIVVSVLLGIAVLLIVYQNFILDEGSGHGHSDSVQLYTCGMHPDIISDEPGNCPICEMKLTPVNGKQLDKGNVVNIDPVVQQNMNLKSALIETRDISPKITTNAEVMADERFLFRLSARMNGWIEKLYIDHEWQEVKKDQLMLEIYSPEIVTAKQELVTALNYYDSIAEKNDKSLLKSGEDLVKNSEKKLELLNVSPNEIEQLKNTRVVTNTTSIYAPVDGVITIKNIVEGQKISIGDDLLHVTDMGKLWIMADVYESELGLIRLGDLTTTTVDAFPAETHEGRVNFIYPTLDKETRTVKVRIDFENNYRKFKHGMLAKVEIEAHEIKNAVVIPENAVIRSGSMNVAVLALENGKFQPVQIRLGVYSEGFYQVIKGLNGGERVVTSAQFLIDSESSLKSAINQFSQDEAADTGMGHAGHDHGATSSLIRTGIIDVETIDENGDGMLYECPMDWNVLSDEDGRCPTCEMRLKQYTLKDVKLNLAEYGYQFK